jgi:phosphopantothenoylcysteine synthetase/decarboxylase
MPGEPRPHPKIDLFIAAPLSANSVAKLALGIGDNQALTVLSEALGTTPMIVFPKVNAAHVQHPAWAGHIAVLRSADVVVVKSGGGRVPWGGIIEATGRFCGR